MRLKGVYHKKSHVNRTYIKAIIQCERFSIKRYKNDLTIMKKYNEADWNRLCK